MTDRELLELAARAAGVELQGVFDSGVDAGKAVRIDGNWWAPLHDDGDALRLAVSCGLVIDTSRPSGGPPFYSHTFAEIEIQDRCAATRRAIVRAAVEIGRNMK